MAVATEILSSTTTTTIATVPESEGLYEVVAGQVREKPLMGAYEVEIACLIMSLMDQIARVSGLGRVVSEMLFRIDLERGLERRPDVAFVSKERWPIGRRAPRMAAWDVVPDLAVEVISPSNRSLDDVQKIAEYFRAGALRVWIVYPNVAQVYVYDSPTSVRILARGDVLDAGPLLPGFQLPLATLFDDEPEPA
jgi:Uma2 family endonuclease